MKYVTFYHDVWEDRVSDLKVHNNKDDALKYFNKHCELNGQDKADKLLATYGNMVCKYRGMSVEAFEQEFDCSVDDALKW